jgi:glycosyltransferase involved in cell wall biosynthesis
MRLLTISHFYEGHGGGIERVAGQLCRQFAAEGHSPRWAAAATGPTPDMVGEAIPLRCWNGIERATGLPMPVPGLGALRALNRAVRTSDAVIIHDALYLTSIAGLVMARLHRKPVLLLQHIADLPLPGRLLARAVRLANRLVTRPMLAAADHVVFISATTRAAFAAVRLRRASLLLFNGVDTSIFYPGDRSHPDKRTILFVGRFVTKKGLSVIEALARSRPDLSFTLAGHGPIDPDGWALANVRVERCRSGASLAALYRDADLLLLPSVGEGYPLVIQEAMACGVPVLCGRDTAQADPAAAAWLTGVEIDLGDPVGTAARISTALDGPRLPAAARTAMAAYAGQAYSWDAIARGMVQAFTRRGSTGRV